MQSILSSMRALALRQTTGDAIRLLHVSAVSEAARKGTREKARKKKVKVEVKKVGFIPHNQRNKKVNVKRADRHVDDSWKQVPKDDCYVGRYYRWPVYSVTEAIQCHRETHHPSMYNVPNAPLNVDIELNMQAEKATRFVDNFQRMAMIPHKFEHGEERKIIVFTKGNDYPLISHRTKCSGASLVGGVELIKDITSGELLLSDYQYIIAHPNILPELVALRGLMKRKFPNPKSETLGANLAEMIVKFSSGISYSAAKDEYQQNFGLITASVGTLDMDEQKLEENIKFLLQDVNNMRPKREGRFITRVLLKSPPSGEQLKIDPFVYVPEMWDKSSAKVKREEAKKQEEPAEVKEAVAAAN
ncbi:hypothetical protein KR018_008912 [Drosophila ironensis]|nr:hypothetical protein KR018_008912 [Drosophila ironensis]